MILTAELDSLHVLRAGSDKLIEVSFFDLDAHESVHAGKDVQVDECEERRDWEVDRVEVAQLEEVPRACHTH